MNLSCQVEKLEYLNEADFTCRLTCKKTLKSNNECRIYMDILRQEKNCRLFRLQYSLAFIGREVYSVGGKGIGEIVILARYRVHFKYYRT